MPAAEKERGGGLRGLGLRLLVLLLSSILTVGLLEAGLRLFHPVPLHFTETFLADGWQTGREGAMGHVPNAVGRVKRAEFDIAVRINSHGLRDREIPYEKPPDVYRILVLGDSQTFGFGVEAEQTYAKLLEQGLKPPPGSPYRRIETLNAGVIGTGTAHQLYFLQEEGWKYRPDAVVVGFFFNDVVENTQCRLFTLRGDRLEQSARAAGKTVLIHEGYRRARSREDVQTFTAPAPVRPALPSFWVRHFHLVRFVRERVSNLVQASRPPDGRTTPRPSIELGARLFEEMARQCRTHEAALLVFLIPAPHQCRDAALTSLSTHYARLLRFLRPSPHGGAPVATLDLLPEIRAAGAPSLYFPMDGHLNRAGHRRVAAALAPELLRLDPRLGRAAAPPPPKVRVEQDPARAAAK